MTKLVKFMLPYIPAQEASASPDWISIKDRAFFERMLPFRIRGIFAAQSLIQYFLQRNFFQAFLIHH
jgi:hypothetical protein